MKRRTWLSTVVLAAGLPGCTDTGSSPRSDGGPSRTEQRTATLSAIETNTDSCEWPDMCEGTEIVEVTVSAQFDGDVVLDASCRDGTQTIAPGEMYSIVRRVDAESCELELTVDGEAVFDIEASGSETYYLTVTAEGEVEVSSAVL